MKETACYIVCADGGANRLKEFQDLLEAESPQYVRLFPDRSIFLTRIDPV